MTKEKTKPRKEVSIKRRLVIDQLKKMYESVYRKSLLKKKEEFLNSKSPKDS